MPEKQEIGIEISYARKYNLGNYQTKEYIIKLSGTQSQLDHQLVEEKQKLTNYIAQLETIVEVANDANKLKARVEDTDKMKEL